MIGLNKVFLIGNVGKGRTIRDAGGSRVANFSLATNKSWVDNSGNKVSEVEWHKVTCFGNLCNIFEKYVNDGQLIYVEGSLKSNVWKDKNGVERKDICINANNLIMLGGKGSVGGDNGSLDAQKIAYINKSRSVDDYMPQPSEALCDEEIPF